MARAAAVTATRPPQPGTLATWRQGRPKAGVAGRPVAGLPELAAGEFEGLATKFSRPHPPLGTRPGGAGVNARFRAGAKALPRALSQAE